MDDWGALIAKVGVGTGMVLYFGQQLMTKFFAGRVENTESGARVEMFDRLTARVAVLEQNQRDQEAQIDAERAARRAAEDKVAALQSRVNLLEAIVKQHGIDIGS